MYSLATPKRSVVEWVRVNLEANLRTPTASQCVLSARLLCDSPLKGE